MNTTEVTEPSLRAAVHEERRLSQRVFLYWLMVCQSRPFAAFDEIESEILGDDWDWCFVIDVARSEEFPFFVHLGASLARYSGVMLSGQKDWTCTLLDKATEKLQETLSHRAPLLVEEELTLFDGREFKFRSILLPLSDDQRNITQVLGAANGKLEAPKAT